MSWALDRQGRWDPETFVAPTEPCLSEALFRYFDAWRRSDVLVSDISVSWEAARAIRLMRQSNDKRCKRHYSPEREKEAPLPCPGDWEALD